MPRHVTHLNHKPPPQLNLKDMPGTSPPHPPPPPPPLATQHAVRASCRQSQAWLQCVARHVAKMGVASAVARRMRCSRRPPRSEAFTWCNYTGENHCTPSWNQHIPKYCGSCFLHATLSMLNDRLKIHKRGGMDVMLSRQTFLNCATPRNISGGCDGGDPIDARARHSLCAHWVSCGRLARPQDGGACRSSATWRTSACRMSPA